MLPGCFCTMDRMTNTTVDTPLAALLTNKRRISALKALGVLTVADALTYYPFRVTDPVPVRALAEARFGRRWRAPWTCARCA